MDEESWYWTEKLKAIIPDSLFENYHYSSDENEPSSSMKTTPSEPDPIIVIVGPTASGKSDVAIALAKKLDGEIISADSRQIYRGMDIGTGKVPKDRVTIQTSRSKFQASSFKLQAHRPYLSSGILHHLIDVASPKVEYNVAHFLRDATRAIKDIQARGKTPIVCGGTTFWIEALVLGLSLPSVKPDKAFREKWGVKDVGELYGYLKRLDPERAKTIDRKNRVRLLRAIEIARALGQVPPLPPNDELRMTNYEFIGLNPPVEELNAKIRTRLNERLKQGMVKEVEKLHASGVSWPRLESFGLEYRAVARLLQGKITREEMLATLPLDIIHYAKRQRSSLRRLEKRGVQIHWVENKKEALEVLRSSSS